MKTLFHRLAAAAAMLALFQSPMALAQQAVPVAATPPTEARPALWKISDEDTIVYLFGTVHALPRDVAWYRGQVAVALDSSLELVTEIGDTDPAVLQASLLRHGILPRGQTLRAQLNAEERARYEAALAKLGIPTDSLDPVKPWFAAIRLVMTALAREGITGGQGVESFITARSKALGQRSSALETADYQFGVFDSLSPEVQKRYLMDIIDNLDALEGELTKIIAAWQEGNAEYLATLMNEGEDDPELANALLYPRNKAWAEWIGQRMARPGIVFIAVGAGHLAGPGSVQEELSGRGLASQRVQ